MGRRSTAAALIAALAALLLPACGSASQPQSSDATGAYIISMARSAADVLGVLALARRAAFVDAGGNVPLDVLAKNVDEYTRTAAG